MSELLNNPRVAIGGNNPPAPTPYETIKMHIDDLMETAQGFLDGDAVETQAVADEIGRLLDEARKAEKAADEQRKIEAKPFDDGKAEVQARYNPLKSRCALVASTAKQALAPFLAAKQAAIDAEAAIARAAAQEATRKAQEALRNTSALDLAAREDAETLLKDANRAEKLADRAEKGRAMVAGGARSVSLRTVWSAALDDAAAALKHYRETRPEDLKAWLLGQAEGDVSRGSRAIPGFTITDTKVAQ